jgi:biopolymer transport protein TolQ
MTLEALWQIRGAVPATPIELITGATTLTKAVLVILAALSLLSWAIMLALWRELARAQKTSLKFFRDFERASRLEEAGQIAKVTAPNALTRLFMRAAHFVSDTRVRNQQTRERDAGESTARSAGTLTGSQIETLHLLLETDAATERDRLGRFLPWLATIGSVSPLIGLLGTVLGVIDAFIGIATKGSGNLSAVAPGVAEALIATAAALTARETKDVPTALLGREVQGPARELVDH